MDELSLYYKELSLLQFKYEHLAGICRTLLKSWPYAEKEKGEQDKPSDNQESTPLSKELDQLDVILKKAERVRAKEESLTKKSMKIDSGIYKTKAHQESGKVQSSSTSIEKTQSKLETKKVGSKTGLPQTGSKCKSKTGSRSIVRDSRRGPPRTSATGGCSSRAKITLSEPSLGLLHQGSSQSCFMDQEKRLTEKEGFSILKNGTQLSIPSKYHKLQTSIYKCSELLREDDTRPASKAAATHFSRRIEAKWSTSCSDRIKLQLAVKEMGIIIEKMTSMTTAHEWTVSERSSWQDVLRMKTKLDLLTQVYETTLPGSEENKSPCKTPGVTLKLLADIPQLAYSSLRDWNEATTLDMQKNRKSWEVKYLTEVRDRLIPLVSQFISETCFETDKHLTVSMLQALYLAGNISTNPVYLDTETK